jgi:phage tail sheath protein FI
MSEYLAPGVFVEEVSFRAKSIEGVGTSVCGMVGPTRFGPVRGTPEVLTSYGEFEKIFGDPKSLTFTKDSGSETHPNYTALAARAFFENGGKQLYLTRIISGGNDTDEYGAGGSAKVAASTAGGKIQFQARYPGSGGNLDLLVVWQDQENLIRSRSFNKFSDIPLNAEGLLTVTILPKQNQQDENPGLENVFVGTVTHNDGKFPLKRFQALVKRTASGFDFLADTKVKVVNVNDTSENINASSFGTGIVAAALNSLPFEFKQTYVITPVTGNLTADTNSELVLNTATDISAFFPNGIGNLTRFRGNVDATGSAFTTVIQDVSVLNNGNIIVNEKTINLPMGLSLPGGLVDPVTIQVTELPTAGAVTLANGTALTDGQNLTAAELAGLQYDAPASVTTNTATSFGYTITHNDPAVEIPVTINITVTPMTEKIPLAVFSAFPGVVKSFKLQRNFSLQVVRRKTTALDALGIPAAGEPVFITPVLSLDKNQPNFIGKILARDLEKTLDKLTIPVVCSIADGTQSELMDDLNKLFVAEIGTGDNIKKILNPDTQFYDPKHVILLAGGTDGDFPAAIDYAGEIDDKGATGFAALESVEDVSIVATPSAVIDKNRHQSIAVELEKHCVKMRYRFGLIDTRLDMSLSEVQNFRNNFDNSRLALYAPWVVTSDPTGEKETIDLPASGFIAGIYARTDVERGVHKAPANTPVFGALRFTQNINKFQQELLNPRGINCLRSFSGRGHQVWGGRTLSSDPEWKYVNVRRYFLYLERSIEKGTQWAVFEPNGERLWANVVTTIESFLFNEWKNGRLLGSKPAAAYFVRCDRTTMSQNDLDNGRLVCEVGVAPLTPAEFVIFRIGQKTADA